MHPILQIDFPTAHVHLTNLADPPT